MVRKIIFSIWPTTADEAEKNLMYRHDNRYELTKEGPLSLVLFESPFISVSTVSSRGHPSPVSLIYMNFLEAQSLELNHLFSDPETEWAIPGGAS
jgi:hypothetical protein